MNIVLASQNKKKIAELRTLLGEVLPELEVLSLADVGIEGDIVEDGDTFEANALSKARAAAASGYIGVGDDSGLCVEALGGAPGVYSARYCEGSDLDRVYFLLDNMKGMEDRTARFVSCVACAFPDGSSIVVRGECPGVILEELKGEGGFGYDPVFYVPEEGYTFAEMPQERKNEISHRAAAMVRFCEELKQQGKI